jgi:hypothetical protein
MRSWSAAAAFLGSAKRMRPFMNTTKDPLKNARGYKFDKVKSTWEGCITA